MQTKGEVWRKRMLEEPIVWLLVRLTTPSVIAITAMFLFGAVDTFFVAKLGIDALAAMSYVFPILFFLTSVGLGLSSGGSSYISRLVGAGKHDFAHRVCAHAVILAFVISCALGLFGLLFETPLLRLAGADATIIELVRQYTLYIYLGVPLLVMPLACAGIIRGFGNATAPAIFMFLAAVGDAIIDPFLIFGYGPFPELGITGASISTVGATGLSLILTLWYMNRHKMLRMTFVGMIDSWKNILSVATISVAGNLLMPIAVFVTLWAVTQYGTNAVAATGVAARLEPLLMVIPVAMTASIPAMVGQSFGAGNTKRVHDILKVGNRTVVLVQSLVVIALIFSATSIAGLFSSEQSIITIAALYMLCIGPTYIFQGKTMVLGSALNALNMPRSAFRFSFYRLLCVVVMLYFGGLWLGIAGVFIGIGLGNIVSGIITLRGVNKLLAISHVETV